MKATGFEYRFRVPIVVLLYVLGFWAPWTRYGAVAPATTAWLALAATVARWRWMSLEAATILITLLSILLTLAGAALRVWGAAYPGPANSSTAESGRIAVSGPYRHVRNPLYAGALLFAAGLSILMPPSGAVLFLLASLVFYLRLILREEERLSQKAGQAYQDYCRKVPRIVPRLAPAPASPAIRAQWVRGAMLEICPIAFFACLATLSWRYEPQLLIRCLIICFGASLVARALLPQHPFSV